MQPMLFDSSVRRELWRSFIGTLVVLLTVVKPHGASVPFHEVRAMRCGVSGTYWLAPAGTAAASTAAGRVTAADISGLRETLAAFDDDPSGQLTEYSDANMAFHRAIIRLGLRRLSSSPRPGLAALLAIAGVSPERVDRETISHVLAPRINKAAINLLTRHGIEVVLAADEACCGALIHHLGRDVRTLDYARTNIKAWLFRIMQNQFYINPVGSATSVYTDNIVFEYVSNQWVAQSGTPTVGAQTD